MNGSVLVIAYYDLLMVSSAETMAIGFPNELSIWLIGALALPILILHAAIPFTYHPISHIHLFD